MGSSMDNQERPWEARKRRGQLMRQLREARDAVERQQFVTLPPMCAEDIHDLLRGMGQAFKPDERDGEEVFAKAAKS